MRVLHVHSGNLYGGVETMLVSLTRHRDLCPQMESHFALCFEGRLKEELTAAGAPVHQLGKVRLRQVGSVLRARRTLRELVDKNDFDLGVCHSSWSRAIFGPVLRSSGLPLVSWFHNANRRRNWLDCWSDRTPPDLSICNSEFTASVLGNRHPGLPAEVVYCPVANRETHSNGDRRAIRAELQTRETATVIVQASRMESWKGHALHLETLHVLKDLPDWICWQVGGGQRPQEIDYLERLKGLALQLGIADRIRFLDQRSNVPRLLRAADIYCQPNSKPEPFGIVFVEALYAGLPVLTTALGGACEIVSDSCGILAPPGDRKALASSLRLLIQNPNLRTRLGATGPERAQKLCDPLRQMNRIAEVLRSAVRQPIIE
ncbi:MAG: glycosyl transferase family 1 [Acidobacteria bacterium]|nr:MAG: glycosyl transferase family 1 [Acidobacteriota bacterium]